MRQIDAGEIEEKIAGLCLSANVCLNEDIVLSLEEAVKNEDNPLAVDILQKCAENIRIAKEENIPVCQDTGMAVVFLEIGQDVHIIGNLMDAVNRGVSRGYTQNYLRSSVVSDPLMRKNTGDNTPAVIHTLIVTGDKIKIKFMPKGFGSENMSRIKMLSPADGIEGAKKFVLGESGQYRGCAESRKNGCGLRI